MSISLSQVDVCTLICADRIQTGKDGKVVALIVRCGVVVPFLTLVQFSMSFFVLKGTVIFEKVAGVCGIAKRILSSNRLQCQRHVQPTQRVGWIITMTAKSIVLMEMVT